MKVKRFNRRIFLIFAVGACYGWILHVSSHPALPCERSPIVIYSNHLRDDLKGCFFKAIQSAKQSIHLQMYGLSDPDIIAILAKKMGANIPTTLFIDPTSKRGLPLPATVIQSKGLMHRKILAIDEKMSFVGSANFTPPSLKMHDNCVVGIYSPQLTAFLSKADRDEGLFYIQNSTVQAFFLPDSREKALGELMRRIDEAKKNIRVAIFTITHPDIVKHLIDAAKRGVHITVIVDHYTAKGASKSQLDRLQQEGIPAYISQGDQLFHHKWALIDSSTFILGSANWTRSAFEKNQDLLLIFDDLPQKLQRRIEKMHDAIEKGARIR